MKKFDINFLTATPILFPYKEIEEDGGVAENIVLPEPTLSDAERFGFDLADYDSEEELLSDFSQSDSFWEWKGAFNPAMTYIHPCDQYANKVQGLANKLSEHGLAVAFVVESEEKSRPSGFILTGGGMDLSTDLAKAYILAGYVPPYEILLNALNDREESEFRPDFVEAASQAAKYMQVISERLLEHVTPEVAVSVSP